jgi:hypothetical protein
MTKKDFIAMLENHDDEMEVVFYNSATDTNQRVITNIEIEENDRGDKEIVIEIK